MLLGPSLIQGGLDLYIVFQGKKRSLNPEDCSVARPDGATICPAQGRLLILISMNIHNTPPGIDQIPRGGYLLTQAEPSLVGAVAFISHGS